MNRKYILEISVESVEAALAAERGGADRIELCCDLSLGGVTPGAGFVSTVQKQILIPVVVMIRPRGGDFVYSTAEFAEMKRAVSAVKEWGLDGVVLGILRKDRQVLSGQGQTVYQECKAISADVQGALRRLQSNAATRASQKKGGTGAKGKSF